MARTVIFARCSDCKFYLEGDTADPSWHVQLVESIKASEFHANRKDHSVTISFAVFKDEESK
jgi:hypothetical protein